MTRVRVLSSDMDLLPHDPEAERIVISGIIADPDALPRAHDAGLKPADFHNRQYRWIMEAAEELAKQGDPIEIASIGRVLERQQELDGNRLDLIGGTPEMAGLIARFSSFSSVGYYAEIVARDARRRQIIAAGGAIAADAQAHEGDLGELYSKAIKALFDAMGDSVDDAHLHGGPEAVRLYRDNQEARQKRLLLDPNALIKTHWPSVDRRLGDLQEGQLIVIGASTSVGKTMAMEQLAEVNASRGHRVVYYHLELSHASMLDRCVARESGVKVQDLRRGALTPQVERALDEIEKWQGNIIYVHCPGWTAERIAADIIRHNARGLCDLAIIDYMQKLSSPDMRGDSRNYAQVVGGRVEVLKNCAERLGIPIILGSQVNRDYKSNANRRPTLEGLRDSGEIAEKANIVLILHNPTPREERNDLDETEIIELYIEKSTDGPLGKVDLVHVKGRFLLGEADKSEERPHAQSQPQSAFDRFAFDNGEAEEIPF